MWRVDVTGQRRRSRGNGGNVKAKGCEACPLLVSFVDLVKDWKEGLQPGSPSRLGVCDVVWRMWKRGGAGPFLCTLLRRGVWIAFDACRQTLARRCTPPIKQTARARAPSCPTMHLPKSPASARIRPGSQAATGSSGKTPLELSNQRPSSWVQLPPQPTQLP